METIKSLGIALVYSILLYGIIAFTALQLNPLEWVGLVRLIFALCIVVIFIYAIQDPDRQIEKEEKKKLTDMYIEIQKRQMDEF